MQTNNFHSLKITQGRTETDNCESNWMILSLKG